MKNLMILLSLLSITAGRPSVNSLKAGKELETQDVTLTVLCDNYHYDENLRSSWGFSCLIEGCGKTILFDCGGNDGNLMHNFKAAGKDPAGVDLIVISHIHGDHTGGLPEFLDARTGIAVFVPASFPKQFKEEIESKSARPEEVTDARLITEHVRTTGEMGKQIIEQSLIIETPGGLVILTGCAHHGIEQIVEKAKKEKDDKVLLIMGGFHLLHTDSRTVETTAADFRDQGIRYAAPTHCSGDGTIRIFKETFGDRYIEAGAGKVIRTGDL